LEYAAGISTSNGNAFDFDIVLKDALTALTDAQTYNLEYVLANDKVQQARKDSASNAAKDKPYLALGANAGLKNGYVPVVTEIRFNYAAGVSLHIPIYDPLKLKYRKLDQTIIKQNELALASLDNTYTKDIQQALTDINTNLERIKNSVGETDQSKAAAELASSRYKNGVGTTLKYQMQIQMCSGLNSENCSMNTSYALQK
jgi:outer membrane protein TolC